MKLKKLDKKAVLGLDTVKSAFILLLIIAIIAIAMILTLSSLRTITDTTMMTSVDIVNQTSTSVNESGTVIPGTLLLRNCVASDIIATNASVGGELIESANYTITNCRIIYKGESGGYNNSIYNLTASYTYSDPETTDILSNISSASSTFFASTGTIFAILIVVVIILAIAIIIAVVSGFGGAGGRIGGGRTSSEVGGAESGTVMGI